MNQCLSIDIGTFIEANNVLLPLTVVQPCLQRPCHQLKKLQANAEKSQVFFYLLAEFFFSINTFLLTGTLPQNFLANLTTSGKSIFQ